MIKETENTLLRNVRITQVFDRGLSKIGKRRFNYKCDSCSTIYRNARIQTGHFLTDFSIPSESSNILFFINVLMGRDSSVGIATAYGLDGPGIESRWG